MNAAATARQIVEELKNLKPQLVVSNDSEMPNSLYFEVIAGRLTETAFWGGDDEGAIDDLPAELIDLFPGHVPASVFLHFLRGDEEIVFDWIDSCLEKANVVIESGDALEDLENYLEDWFEHDRWPLADFYLPCIVYWGNVFAYEPEPTLGDLFDNEALARIEAAAHEKVPSS